MYTVLQLGPTGEKSTKVVVADTSGYAILYVLSAKKLNQIADL